MLSFSSENAILPPLRRSKNSRMEICIDSLESARNAIEGGATRLEVCSALSEGGLTPTPGLVAEIQRFSKSVPLFAMLRPRGGDFVYSVEEIRCVTHDLRILKEQKVDGFVFGALTSSNDIDVEACKEILSTAAPLPVTFHRAFDQVVDPLGALESLVDLGFQRILTSGQKDTAQEGLEMIRTLVRAAGGRIIVMPGSGIGVDNILGIKAATGAVEFHASAKRRKILPRGGNKVRIAGDTESNFIMVTDKDSVKELVAILRAS